MKIIVIVILFILFLGFTGYVVYKKIANSVYELEEAYFEGQKDAIEGDVRIKKLSGKWMWSGSPWDDGAPPKFVPK